jgi:hypothetical protein
MARVRCRSRQREQEYSGNSVVQRLFKEPPQRTTSTRIWQPIQRMWGVAEYQRVARHADMNRLQDFMTVLVVADGGRF